jgi:hypothetical protein
METNLNTGDMKKGCDKCVNYEILPPNHKFPSGFHRCKVGNNEAFENWRDEVFKHSVTLNDVKCFEDKPFPFSDQVLIDAILKIYPKDDVRELAQQSRNGIRYFMGDKEIGFRPNDSTTLNEEYIDGFTAGYNYIKNKFIEESQKNNKI